VNRVHGAKQRLSAAGPASTIQDVKLMTLTALNSSTQVTYWPLVIRNLLLPANQLPECSVAERSLTQLSDLI